jgi:hypothetical protein
MSEFATELSRLIAKVNASVPVDAASEDAVALVQHRLPAGVGAPVYDANILERARAGAMIPSPHVLSLQAAYEVIQELVRDRSYYKIVAEAASGLDACLRGNQSAASFADKRQKLKEALELLRNEVSS